ncbi:MAG TPA: class I SAM-dependent methyltransferase [Fimbriimonadales bacterium]|jgi:SAM-dependent methyltransferase|nr:class I SAM-dependent methyltransferase [Fimbriimonadales bacterium]
MKLSKETLEISGGRKLYLYIVEDDSRTNRMQTKFWSAVSEEWRERSAEMEKWMAPITEALLSPFHYGGGRMLDIGCGPQSMQIPSTWSVTGCDIAAAMLPPVVAAADRLPFASRSFDAAVSRCALMLAADAGRAISEMARVLRPGGIASFSVWGAAVENSWDHALLPVLERRFGLRAPDPRAPHAFRLGNPDEVFALLGGAGFGGITQRKIAVPFLSELSAQEAVRHLVAFVGPFRTVLSKFADQADAALQDAEQALAKVDRMGTAWVWTAVLPLDA